MRRSRNHSDGGTEDLDELQAIEDRRRALEEQIQSITAEPDKIRREAEEQAATLPPPDDLADRRRLREFEEVVSRRQVRNERRTQGRSLVLFFLLIAATIALGSWVLRLFQA